MMKVKLKGSEGGGVYAGRKKEPTHPHHVFVHSVLACFSEGGGLDETSVC